MEKINLIELLNQENISLPPRNEHTKRLIEKTEHFLGRLRWRAYYFLSGQTAQNRFDTPKPQV